MMHQSSSSKNLCLSLLKKRSQCLWMALLACCEVSSAFGDWYSSSRQASLSPERQPRLRGSAGSEAVGQRLAATTASSNNRSSTSSTSSSSNSRRDGSDGDSPTTPEQIHLALADARPRETYTICVSWLTWEDAKSQVFWGSDGFALEEVVTGNSTSYTTEHANLNLTAVTSGRLHSATIEGLEPSSTFYYACGDENLGLSTTREFRTPGYVRPNQTVTLGILGDLGQTNDSAATLDSVLAHKPAIDVVLHAGDLSYADCHEERWDSFLRMLDPVASRIPWMVAAGNHEIEVGTTVGGPFAAYEYRFRMPAAGAPVRSLACGTAGGLDGNETACGAGLNDLGALMASTEAANAGLGRKGVAEAALRAREAIVPWRVVVTTGWEKPDGEREGGDDGDSDAVDDPNPKCCPSEWSGTYDYGNSFYSFDVASVHVVVLNPYTATGEGSSQHSWLIKDLRVVDRSLTPWVVAMFHCPWHNSNVEHQSERQALTAMRAMEPVLFQHRTAFVITGHVHGYERSLPALSGEVTEGAPVHVVVGASGNKEAHDPDYYRLPEWSAFRNGSAFGFGALSVMNSTAALWEWKSNDPEPVVHDATWIVNPFLLG